MHVLSCCSEKCALHFNKMLRACVPLLRRYVQDIKWFELVTVEKSKGVFVTQPKGDLCDECGRLCEAWPQLDPAQVATKYKSDATYKLLFETCRKVLRGEAPRSWRPSVVAELQRVGILLALFISELLLTLGVGHDKTPTHIKVKVVGYKLR